MKRINRSTLLFFALSILISGCSTQDITGFQYTHYIQEPIDEMLIAGSDSRMENHPVVDNISARNYTELFSLQYEKQTITFLVESTLLPDIFKYYDDIIKATSYIKNRRIFSKDFQYNVNFHFTTAMSFSEKSSSPLAYPTINLYQGVSQPVLEESGFNSYLSRGYSQLIHELTHVAIIQSKYAVGSPIDNEYLAHKVAACALMMKDRTSDYSTFTNSNPNLSRQEMLAKVKRGIKKGLLEPTEAAGKLVIYDLATAVGNNNGISNQQQYKKARLWCNTLSEHSILSDFSTTNPAHYDNSNTIFSQATANADIAVLPQFKRANNCLAAGMPSHIEQDHNASSISLTECKLCDECTLEAD